MPRTFEAAAAWLLITVFIVYGSSGPLTSRPVGLWGPFHISIPDVLQNVLLFFPFGCFGVLALDGVRRLTPRRIAVVVALAITLSVLAETAQLFMVDRTASVTDVIAGTLGAAMGALSAPQVARLLGAALERARALGITGSGVLLPLMAWWAALAVVAWWPFDITLDVSTVSERVKVLRADPWQGGDAIELGSQALRYAIGTMLVAASLARLRAGAAVLLATLCGVFLAIVLDAGQVAMGAHPAGIAHLAFQVAGCLVGGALFVTWRKAERHLAA